MKNQFDLTSLSKEDREIVNRFAKIFTKYRDLGTIRLVELVSIAWEKEHGYNHSVQQKKVNPKEK